VLTLLLDRAVIGDNQAPAQVGNGWQLSVAILEAQNLPMVDENGLKRDPFVMLGAGGQSRTSSVKVQGQDTRWNGEKVVLQRCSR
jgi:Ca2+-dependent lipid-binding protein